MIITIATVIAIFNSRFRNSLACHGFVTNCEFITFLSIYILILRKMCTRTHQQIHISNKWLFFPINRIQINLSRCRNILYAWQNSFQLRKCQYLINSYPRLALHEIVKIIFMTVVTQFTKTALLCCLNFLTYTYLRITFAKIKLQKKTMTVLKLTSLCVHESVTFNFKIHFSSFRKELF